MLVLGRIRRWMLGNVCHRSISRGGFLVWAVFFFQQKIRDFTGCDDDDVFVELPK